MKKLLTLLLLSCFLFSCEKKEDLPDYPVTMTLDGIEPISDIRLFTSGGTRLDLNEDAAAISAFLERNYWIGSTWYNGAFREPEESDRKAEFVFYGDGRIDYTGVTEITNVEQRDEVTILQSSVINDIDKNSALLLSDFVKYPFHILPDGRRYRSQYVMRGDERSGLEVFLLSYKLIRYDEDNKLQSVNVGTVYNELNESFIQTIGENDTLAVRSYLMQYSSK